MAFAEVPVIEEHNMLDEKRVAVREWFIERTTVPAAHQFLG